MTALPSFGIRLHGGQTAASALALARAADEAGFAGLWFAENAFGRGILPLAAACAAATTRVRIGAGVFNPFARHPTLMAMEVGALDELCGGRASLSIGSGIAAAVRRLGLDADRPVPALRDTLRIVPGLLAGETVDYRGKVFSAEGVKLEYAPRADIPIYLAGRGPLTLKLAGELADGLVISNMCSPGYAARAARLMAESRAAAGRTGSARIIHYMPCIVGDDPADTTARACKAVARMLPGFWTLSQKVSSVTDGLTIGSGITEPEFALAASRLLAGADPVDVLDERFIAAFTLTGTAQTCVRQARQFAAAGITDLALTFEGAGANDDIQTLGRAFTPG